MNCTVEEKEGKNDKRNEERNMEATNRENFNSSDD